MNEDIRDPQLQALFSQAQQDLSSEPFTAAALIKIEQHQQRAKWRRLAIGLAVFVIAIPLQDMGLALSQVLMVSLIDLPNNLATTLLAPVNSLGGVLTAVLMGLRLTQKRLFS